MLAEAVRSRSAMQVTIRDVAREAGVSVATVSRAFNDSGPVHAETRRRVREVARRLRYAPNGAARSLITSRTNTLGVLLPDLYGEFFSEVIRGIDQMARRHGFHILVSSSHNDRAEFEAAVHAMRGRVDGLILMSPHLDSRAVIAELPESLPVILINCAAHEGGFGTLRIDNHAGAYAMVRHLVELGHQRVAIITGPAGNFDAAERVRGYRGALRDAGMRQARQWELPGDFTETSGYRAALAALALRPRPTAIFATNDSMAIGALSALRERGVAVPDEMTVSGFDDIPMARYMSPPLSSVHVNIAELGARAAERLMRDVASSGRRTRRHELLPTTLVIRNSCGRAPAA